MAALKEIVELNKDIHTVATPTAETFEFNVADRAPVSALMLRPDDARLVYVLGHGAGGGMRHPFMESVATGLYDRGVATLRYQFPYIEAGRKSPDPPHVLEETVRSALATATKKAGNLPIIAGGKSMGGRITSQVAAKHNPEQLKGIVLLGFPLHAPKRPSDQRAAHLFDVKVPMLFLQGTRDDLTNLTLLRPIIEKLGKRATLHIIDGGNHSFKVPKRTGRTEKEVMDELLDAIDQWANSLCELQFP